MNTKNENISNPHSCWNKAGGDEPVFVLRANDVTAPDMVIMWANKYAVRKGGHRHMSERERDKFLQALDVAQAMREFYRKVFDADIPF